MSGQPSHFGPILDYASPRQHGKVRLPSQSRILVKIERDGVVVREWLEAKAGAITAMALSVVALIALAVTASHAFNPRMHAEDRIIMIGLPAGVGACEILVLLLVINNTWRTTILEARSDALLLTFTAPFGRRRYEWGASQVEDMRVELTTNAEHRNSLGELEVHLAGLPLVKLFTDHPAPELQPLAAQLRHAVGLEPSPSQMPMPERNSGS